MKKLILISTIVIAITTLVITISLEQVLYKNDDEASNRENELSKMHYFDKCTSTVPLDTTIIQKSGSSGTFERLVFFLEPDSIGYLCVRYSTDLGNTGLFEIPSVIHKDIFSSNSIEVPHFVLDIEPNPIPLDNGMYDVIYILQPSGKVDPGIYWISFSQLCDALPVVIGLDDVNGSQIPVREGRTSCPIKYFDVDIIGFGKMSMRYETANIKS